LVPGLRLRRQKVREMRRQFLIFLFAHCRTRPIILSHHFLVGAQLYFTSLTPQSIFLIFCISIPSCYPFLLNHPVCVCANRYRPLTLFKCGQTFSDFADDKHQRWHWPNYVKVKTLPRARSLFYSVAILHFTSFSLLSHSFMSVRAYFGCWDISFCCPYCFDAYAEHKKNSLTALVFESRLYFIQGERGPLRNRGTNMCLGVGKDIYAGKYVQQYDCDGVSEFSFTEAKKLITWNTNSYNK